VPLHTLGFRSLSHARSLTLSHALTGGSDGAVERGSGSAGGSHRTHGAQGGASVCQESRDHPVHGGAAHAALPGASSPPDTDLLDASRTISDMRVGDGLTPSFRHARSIALTRLKPVPRATRTMGKCGRCSSFKRRFLSPVPIPRRFATTNNKRITATARTRVFPRTRLRIEQRPHTRRGSLGHALTTARSTEGGACRCGTCRWRSGRSCAS
jgi:hypothetical protein